MNLIGNKSVHISLGWLLDKSLELGSLVMVSIESMDYYSQIHAAKEADDTIYFLSRHQEKDRGFR